MTAQIKGDKLIIEIEFNEVGYPSATGKTKVHASTHGNQPSNVQVNGKTLVIGLNAYTPNR